MKFVFFLFGIYLMVLSCIPCSDSIEMNTHSEITVSSTESHNGHSNEACTPFCLCSCCSISVFYSQSFKSITVKPVINRTAYFIHQDNHIQTTQNSIWQPPRCNA